jgi:hypothetical protein
VSSYPVFINSRDRLEPLLGLVAWLERAGCEEIYVLDNDSAYEPLLEWFEQTPHTVLPLGENSGKWSLWQAPGMYERIRGRRFAYTDPDIVPVAECPLDALDRFSELLDRYRLPHKAGFGLLIDDLPDHYWHKDAVLAAEAPMWQWPLERGVYYAPIDTTFDLYREGSSWAREAIRMGPPYVARHDSWYMDFDRLTEEERFYAERAVNETSHTAGMAHWVAPALDDRHSGFAAKEPANRPGLVTRLRWRIRGRRAVRKGAS